MPAVARPFLPWIAYAVLSSFTDWRWGALAGLVLTAAGLVFLRRSGRPWDAAVIEVCSVLYFGAVAALALADPHSPLHGYTQGASALWVAVAAWGSLLIGRPFTLGIAKADVPRAYWDSPVFRHVNRVVTTVWAAAFTASGVLMLALRGQGTALVAVNVAGFVLPAVLTTRYTAAVRARRTPPAGAAEPGAASRPAA